MLQLPSASRRKTLDGDNLQRSLLAAAKSVLPEQGMDMCPMIIMAASCHMQQPYTYGPQIPGAVTDTYCMRV